jgi:hypothetical protein
MDNEQRRYKKQLEENVLEFKSVLSEIPKMELDESMDYFNKMHKFFKEHSHLNEKEFTTNHIKQEERINILKKNIRDAIATFEKEISSLSE